VRALRIGERAELCARFPPGAIAAMGGGPDLPEPLLGALISRLLGTALPGPGTNWLKLQLDYTAAAPMDAEITARAEITRIRPATGLVDLAVACHRPGGQVLCRGRALTRAPWLVGEAPSS